MIWKKLKKSLMPEEKKSKSSPAAPHTTHKAPLPAQAEALPPPKKTEDAKTPPRRILTAEGWKRMMLGKKTKK